METSEECNPKVATHLCSLLGVLRWSVELARVDICCEVFMMSSSLDLLCTGNLDQVYHICGYLKKYHNTEIIFDPSDPEVDPVFLKTKDWFNNMFGLDDKEEVSLDMPESREMGFVIRAYVDMNHVGDYLTRRSTAGFHVYLNSTPVY